MEQKNKVTYDEKTSLEKISEIEMGIQKLLEEKRNLLHSLNSHKKKLKYLKIEKEVLEKILKDYNEEELKKLQNKLKGLEFKIQTSVLNQKKEKALVKKIVEIEKKLANYRPMIRAKKRIGIIEEKIKKFEELIKEKEKEIEKMKKQINDLVAKKREIEKTALGFSLTEVAVIEEKNKKEKIPNEKKK
jgi:uncharacterized coiled-coil DUF342 family protein